MTRLYISRELRQEVREQADGLCEYCLLAETDGASHQVDHIISVKHGGETRLDNLAYACLFCNLHKGTDLGSIVRQTGELARFFNPRRDRWGEHFDLEGIWLRGRSPIGEVTERIFQFNSPDRLSERELLIAAKVYPSAAAQQRMSARDR